jgi:hypothetical protein
MKSIDWLSLTRQRTARALSVVALAVFAFACSDDSVAPSPADDAAARKNKELTNSSANSNSTTSADLYCVTWDNTLGSSCWTYTITRKPGAKALSHFILNLDNCPNPAVTAVLSMDNILNATVNDQPAVLSDSEGGGTGCEITSSSFVKFDDLPDADVYVIKFTLDAPHGNFIQTTAWLKAGTSCFSLPIIGPCCPL